MNRNKSNSSIRSSIFVMAALFAAALAGCATSPPAWNHSNEMASLADFGGGGGDGGSGGGSGSSD